VTLLSQGCLPAMNLSLASKLLHGFRRVDKHG
jgi:hypothetical protein